MPSLINWAILKEPYNWIIIMVAVTFGTLFLAVLMPQQQGSDGG